MKANAKNAAIILLIVVLAGCGKYKFTSGRATIDTTSLPEKTTYSKSACVPEKVALSDYEVTCADAYSTQVHEAVSSASKSVVYTLTHGKDGKTAIIRVSPNDQLGFSVTVEDDDGKVIQTLTSDSLYWKAITFVDANADGHADIQLYVGGTLNEIFDLYLWDSSIMEFSKVLYQGFDMLATFEVESGFLINWVKSTATTGVIQHLKWDGNTLVKIFEETYNLEDEGQGTDTVGQVDG